MVSVNGTDYREVVKDVVEWTSAADFIIGHNILGFDIYFLSAFYRLVGRSPVGLAEKIIDTHALAKGLKMSDVFDRKKSSLLEYQYRIIHTMVKGLKTRTSILGPEYGIEHDYENLHDALVDLQLNLKIWNQLKYQVNI
jgi:DNA polymerase III epsilon subunit-like protein